MNNQHDPTKKLNTVEMLTRVKYAAKPWTERATRKPDGVRQLNGNLV